MPSKRPLLHRLIGKNYVGPGNAVDSAETLGEVDQVARHHDILYQAIEESGVNLESVNSADISAANDFAHSAINSAKNGQFSDAVIGAVSSVALSGKAAVEKLIGEPVYPKMAPYNPRKHKAKPTSENPLNLRQGQVGRVTGYQKANLKRAQDKLANLQAAGALPQVIAEQEAKIRKMKGEHQQWQGANDYHQVAEAHRNLQLEIEEFNNMDTVLETPPASRQEGTIDDDSFGGAGPETQLRAPKRARPDPIDLETPSQIDTPFDPFNLMPENVEAGNVNQAINQNPMEIIQSNDAYLTSLGIEDNMAQIQQVIRSGGARYEDGHIIIENSDLFYSWGYNFTGLDIADASATGAKQRWLMTPMAYVPVDYLPFYMSQAQFDDLPGEADVVSVSCKVTPWGSRVSFQTNADTSSPATAQHVVVGMSAIGLNTEPTFNWANRDVTESNTMVISTHSTPSTSKLISKLWGTNNSATWYQNVPSTFGAIRQLDIYGGPVVDNYVAPVAASGTTAAVAEYIPTGWPDLGAKTNRFAYDAFKGKPVINYEYQPKFGTLKSKARRWQSNRSDVGGTTYVYHGGNDSQAINTSINRCVRDGTATQTGTSNTISLTNFTVTDASISPQYQVYNCMIEQDRCKQYVGDVGKPVAIQPQLHVGILPVQANQPGASVGFVCAAAYWQIDRVIKIKVNFGTAFNLVVARPIDGLVSYYNDGMDDTFCLGGTVAGRISKQQPYN